MQAYIFFYNAMIKCDLCSFYLDICLDSYHIRIFCMLHAFFLKKFINITFAFVFQAESVLFVVLSDSGSDLTGSSAFGTDVFKCYL